MFRRKKKSFDRTKLKTSLKMAKHRMRLHYKKMENEVKVKKKSISQLLLEANAAKSDAKRIRVEEKAMVRVESLIHDEHMMEANELAELYGETIEARLMSIAGSRTPPADSKKAICSVIYASTKMQPQCEELLNAARQFEMLYGSEFITSALANDMGCADERLVHKLSVEPPSKTLVIQTMVGIAEEYDIEWTYEEESLVTSPAASTSITPGPPGPIPQAPPSSFLGGGGGGGSGGGSNIPIATVAEPTFPPVGIPVTAAKPVYGTDVPVINATAINVEEEQQQQPSSAAAVGPAPTAPIAATAAAVPQRVTGGGGSSSGDGIDPAEAKAAKARAAEQRNAIDAELDLPVPPSGFVANPTPSPSKPAVAASDPDDQDDDGVPDFLRPYARPVSTDSLPPAAPSVGMGLPPAAPSSTTTSGGGGDGDVPDYDDLAARFAALRS